MKEIEITNAHTQIVAEKGYVRWQGVKSLASSDVDQLNERGLKHCKEVTKHD